MRYSARRPFSGDPAAALQAVETTLLPNGFRLVKSSPSHLEWKGPGMQSSKENPLRGATEILFQARDGFLKLDASLGGVRAMSLFVCLFPLVLWGGFAVAGLMKPRDDGGAFMTSALWGVGIWLILGPALSLWFRRRTTRALEDMLANAAACARRRPEAS